uniref:Uncharacterized protein n=1 Tax=Arundo donax TaxID=35708 RepID=A0A0A8Z731_ARUDO
MELSSFLYGTYFLSVGTSVFSVWNLISLELNVTGPHDQTEEDEDVGPGRRKECARLSAGGRKSDEGRQRANRRIRYCVF